MAEKVQNGYYYGFMGLSRSDRAAFSEKNFCGAISDR
jgi:hypothetical protein